MPDARFLLVILSILFILSNHARISPSSGPGACSAGSGRVGAIIADELRVATFDCYGTLVDWEGGAGSFLYELALRHDETSLEPG